MYENKISETAKVYVQEMWALLEAKADGMGIREAETLRKVQESLLGDRRSTDPKTGRFVRVLTTPEGCLKRFLSFIDFFAVNGCWVWTGKKTKRNNPYGMFNLVNKEIIRPHVLSCRLFHGDLAPGMEVMHLCQRHACVRPDHIKQATHAENIKHDRAGIYSDHCRNGHDLNIPEAFTQYWTKGKYGPVSNRRCKLCAAARPKYKYNPEARHRAWLRKKERMRQEHLSISGKRIEL